MKRLTLLCALFLSLILMGCGRGKEFVLEGLVDGYINSDVRVVYAGVGGDFIHQTAVTDEKGRFQIVGDSPEETIIEIYLPADGLVAVLVAKNGDKVQVKLWPKRHVVEARGNKTASLLADWFTDNSESIASFNYAETDRSILKFIADNPDSKASAALLLTMFDARKNGAVADSLSRAMIEHEVMTLPMMTYMDGLQQQIAASEAKDLKIITYRTLKDSVETSNLYDKGRNIIAFEISPVDINRDTLMSLWKDREKCRLRIFEISLSPDSAGWKHSLTNDSVSWIRGWMPGMAGSPSWSNIAPARVPFYVVIDSTGRQIYRGESVSEMSAVVRANAVGHRVPAASR